MSDLQEVERIRFKMQRIRQYMDDDVMRLQSDAAQLMDWKYYVLRHPIASLAAVAAAGYFLVPKPQAVTDKKIYLDPEATREAIQRSDGLRVDQEEKVAKQSILMTLGTLAVSTLVKAGMNYFSQQVRHSLFQDFYPRAGMKERNPT